MAQHCHFSPPNPPLPQKISLRPVGTDPGDSPDRAAGRSLLPKGQGSAAPSSSIPFCTATWHRNNAAFGLGLCKTSPD